MEDIEDCYVEITSENKERIKDMFYKKFPKTVSRGWSWSIGAYYGIRHGECYGHGLTFGKVITEEELKRRLNHEEVINEYEIY